MPWERSSAINKNLNLPFISGFKNRVDYINRSHYSCLFGETDEHRWRITCMSLQKKNSHEYSHNLSQTDVHNIRIYFMFNIKILTTERMMTKHVRWVRHGWTRRLRRHLPVTHYTQNAFLKADFYVSGVSFVWRTETSPWLIIFIIYFLRISIQMWNKSVIWVVKMHFFFPNRKM